jgi:hypothetical protein
MAAKIVYFGTDNCHRLPVLRRAGYVVENCQSAEHLRGLLASGDIDAVLTTDREGDVPDVVALVRSQSALPLVLFRDSNHSSNERRFELVIAALTAPPNWLAELALLIHAAPAFGERSRGPHFDALHS